MTIETLEKRIEGKKKAIEKLEKKMARIEKAKASDWKDNPYYYHESDLKYTERDLENERKALDGYMEQLQKEKEKAQSRNIKPILDFLDKWKSRVRQFHIDRVSDYLKARAEWYAYDHEFTDWWNSGGRRNPAYMVKQKRQQHKEKQEEFYQAWKWLMEYMQHDTLDLDKLDKALNKEADAKYDDIIERTNHITGRITDATNLGIGAKGELNGYIIGEKGKAKVETIGAGGYNIQCYHFRTLIHEVRGSKDTHNNTDL